MNLLTDPWIPARARSGGRLWIRPSDMTSGLDSDPIVAIDAPRPDFNGALMQFLIGLCQTALPPDSDATWARLFRSPPPPDALDAALEGWQDAFHFGPDRPSFMEDRTLEAAADKPIASLLIDAPGGNALKENKDVFVKRVETFSLCPQAAAMTLWTLQCNAPSGGVGHRTSIRGGGPLTTLVINRPQGPFDTLWHNVWANVLTTQALEQLPGNRSADPRTSALPWMNTTRVSDKTGAPITPENAHPLLLFWGMSRRIGLDWASAEPGVCSITGIESDQCLSHFGTKNYGENYEGAWLHPLTPYRDNPGNPPLPRHPNPGGIGYRHWMGLTMNLPKQSRPAAVVSAWADRVERVPELHAEPTSLRAFGFDMDNAKVRCWYESTMPLIHVPEPAQPAFAAWTRALVEAAEFAGVCLRSALIAAWFKRPSDARGDMSFVQDGFWQATETTFFRDVSAFADAVVIADEDQQFDATQSLAERWHCTLRTAALQRFDLLAASSRIDAEDPARIAMARAKLRATMQERKMRQMLNLPLKPAAAAGQTDAA